MSFFTRKKGKKKETDRTLEPPSQTESVLPDSPHEVHVIDNTPPMSPVGHTVQTQSIFSGLHLSSKVALGEAPDSPYTKRTSSGNHEEDNVEHANEEELDEVSSFSFLTSAETRGQEEASPLSASFSFLEQPVAPGDQESSPTSQDQATNSSDDFDHSKSGSKLQNTPSGDTQHVHKVATTQDGQVNQYSALGTGDTQSSVATTQDGQVNQYSALGTGDTQSSAQDGQVNQYSALGTGDTQSSVATTQVKQSALGTGDTQSNVATTRDDPPKQSALGSGERKKKKKRTAIRPGQYVTKDPSAIPTPEECTPSSDGLEQVDATVCSSKDISTSSILHANEESYLDGNLTSPVRPDQMNKGSALLQDEVSNLAVPLNEESKPSIAGPVSEVMGVALQEETVLESKPLPVDQSSAVVEIALQKETLVESKTLSEDQMALPIETLSEDQMALPIESTSGSANYTIVFTPQENLTGLLQSFANGLSRLRNDFLAAEVLHKGNVLEQMEMAQDQADKWSEDRLLRDKEATALAEEDYELAEKLSRQLDATGMKPEGIIFSAGLMEISKWVRECSKEMENEVTFQKEMETKLSALRGDHSATLEELKRNQTSQLAKEKMLVQSLQNQVEREAGHIALDCSHLEKREQLLEEERFRRAADFIGKKEQLTKELDNVESEIQHLEAKLLQLRSQREDIVVNIAGEQEHISAVEEEMYEERQQLRSERASFQERQDKLAGQQAVLSKKERTVLDMENMQDKERGALEQLTQDATAVGDEVQKAVSLHDRTSNEVQQLLDFIQEGEKLLKPSESLLKCQSGVEIKKKEVERETEEILVGQNKLSQRRRIVRDLQAQLLEIQESKKAAVTGRQFKEASRLAGESKAMELHVQEEQEQLSEAEQVMALSSSTLAQLSDELCAMREEVLQLERGEDEAHIQDLLLATTTLSNLEDVLGSTFLISVVENWKQLYVLLIESLSSKHGMKRNESLEKPRISELGSVEPTGVSSEEKSKRLMEIERDIEKACQQENYDRAAELEEELQALKSHHDD